MKLTLKYIAVILIGAIALSSCSKHPDSPGYEYMPDMYRSQAIEAYVDYGMVGDEEKGETNKRLKNTQSARTPAEGTIQYYSDKNKAKLMMPFKYGKADLDTASANLKIPESFLGEHIDENIKEGKRLFEIMCMHCHGKTGQGDGGVVEVGGYNPPSPYSGAYKERSLGGIFHVITYGKGAMGSHASQLNKIERWKVAMYVRTLQHGDFNLGGLTGSVIADTLTAAIDVAVFTETIAPAGH
jgi:mono/diheme cytochrome c family protein